MNVKGTMTVRMAASTDLAPTSVHVLEGTCCIQMDGVVNPLDVLHLRLLKMAPFHVTGKQLEDSVVSCATKDTPYLELEFEFVSPQ